PGDGRVAVGRQAGRQGPAPLVPVVKRPASRLVGPHGGRGQPNTERQARDRSHEYIPLPRRIRTSRQRILANPRPAPSKAGFPSAEAYTPKPWKVSRRLARRAHLMDTSYARANSVHSAL